MNRTEDGGGAARNRKRTVEPLSFACVCAGESRVAVGMAHLLQMFDGFLDIGDAHAPLTTSTIALDQKD